MNKDILNLKLDLLQGNEIIVENIPIKPYTISEMVEYGFSDFTKNVQWLCVTVTQFIDSIDDIEKKMEIKAMQSQLKPYDFYMSLGGEAMQEEFLKAIRLILRSDDVEIVNGVIVVGFHELDIIKRDDDGNYIINEEKITDLEDDELKLINRDNYDSILQVIKFQNNLDRPSDSGNKKNPHDEETALLMKQMDEYRDKANKRKRSQSDDDESDFADLISAVATRSSSYDLQTIWNLTLYQFFDEFRRLDLSDNYDFSTKAILAGAKKVEIKHWSSKI